MINLQAPLNQLGYGQAGYNVAVELGKRKDFHLSPIGNPEVYDNSEVLQKAAQSPFFHDGHSIRMWHQHDLKSHIGKGKKIGWPIFELDTFTEVELHNLSYCDELFACSEWAKTVCDGYGLKSSVVPLGVDRTIFYPHNDYNENYVFLTVGKWEKRKGHAELIETFNQNFRHDDNVELWMCCDNPFLKPHQKEYWEGLCIDSRLSDKIRIIPRQKTHKDLARLMRHADCGVFPSRAEGWGMPILEMMSCDKPVITTNYSAMKDYCNQDNSYLVNPTGVEPAYDGVWFTGQGNWAYLDSHYFQTFGSYMRMLYDKKIRTNNSGIATATTFSWKNTVDKILDAL